jgi:tetratricopeptide (TPR) repeat protein
MGSSAHAFVAMPFGSKPDRTGQLVDFNRVFADYIRPAVEAAGMTVLRADQDRRAGDIRTDMFQELLMADLVVADLTSDNPNVWYEVGVRHAVRARGVVLLMGVVAGVEMRTPFDVYTDRKLHYTLKDGAPDPATLEADRAALTEMVTATMESWQGRKISPVYDLLPNLQEPDWTTLRIGDVQEFWEKYDTWEGKIEIVRRADRIGDLLVLADEGPVAAFRGKAWLKAGEALRKGGRPKIALEYLDKGLAIEPGNLRGLYDKGICLQRLAVDGSPGHSLDRARAHYDAILKQYPKDTETWALRGRIDKDAWIAAWRRTGSSPEQMRADAAYEDALLRAAIESYATAFRGNPGHYYSGINALTLMHLAGHLTGETQYETEAKNMAGAVRFAAACETEPGAEFWAKATLGDLEVLVGTPAAVVKAYKEAIAKTNGDWFALNSSRDQLRLLEQLGFRPEAVAAAMTTFNRAIERLQPADEKWEPRQVFLFSGHMVDEPGRPEARFPAAAVPEAARRLAEALDKMGAGPEDVAFSQASAGGDLLFVEACLQRGVQCRIRLPFDEPRFIDESILPSADGTTWRDRYYAAKAKLEGPEQLRIMPDELGPLPDGANAFERCNLWLLYSALSCGMDKVRFVCLWDGETGKAGGTGHMYEAVKSRTARITRIDPRELTLKASAAGAAAAGATWAG